MSNVLRSFLYSIIVTLMIFIVMTISGKTTREVELEDNLASATEQTLQEVLTNSKYTTNKCDIKNDDEFVGIFLERLLINLNAEGDVTVDIVNADKDRGILSLKVTEKYTHPNGETGTIQYTKTVVLEDYKTESKYIPVTVTFMVDDTVYKKEDLTIEKGEDESFIYPILDEPQAPTGDIPFYGWCTEKNKPSTILNLYEGYEVKKDTILYAYFDDSAHNFEILEESQPTCTKNGFIKYHCIDEDCGLIYYKTLKAVGHKVDGWTVVEPTCTEDGYQEAVCTVCGETIHKELKAEGHIYNDPVVKSTEKVGTDKVCCKVTYGKTCKKCGYEDVYEKKTSHTPAVNDDGTENWLTMIPAGCTEDGKAGLHCSVCDKLLKEKSLPHDTYGHAGEWVITKNPTCLEKGEASLTCTKCKKTVSVSGKDLSEMDKLNPTRIGDGISTWVSILTPVTKKDSSGNVLKDENGNILYEMDSKGNISTTKELKTGVSIDALDHDIVIKNITPMTVGSVVLTSADPLTANSIKTKEKKDTSVTEKGDLTDLLSSDMDADNKATIVVKTNEDIDTKNVDSFECTDEGLYVLTYSSEKKANEAITDIEDTTTTDYIQKNDELHIETTENTQLAGMATVSDTKEDEKNTLTVAILDTGYRGINSTRILKGYNAIDSSTTVKDENGHGSLLAEIILKNSNASVMPIKVADEEGTATILSVYRGIIYAVDNGADVINISLSGKGYSPLLEDAVNYATEHGVKVITSAGNYGKDAYDYMPGNIPNVINIGSVNKDMTIADYSNTGDYVDYYAYGEYDGQKGTSISSAYASAYYAENKRFNNILEKDGIKIIPVIKYDGEESANVVQDEMTQIEEDLKENGEKRLEEELENGVVSIQTSVYNIYFNVPYENPFGYDVYYTNALVYSLPSYSSANIPEHWKPIFEGIYERGAVFYTWDENGTWAPFYGTLPSSNELFCRWNNSIVWDFYIEAQYKELNSDLRNLTPDQLWAHFLNYGMGEFRRASKEFDPNQYRAMYSDVYNQYRGVLYQYYYHWANYGKSEGRWGQYNVVTYNPNGGTMPNDGTVNENNQRLSNYGREMQYYTHYNHSATQSLPTPTKTGHTFDGWYTAASGGAKITDTTKEAYYTDHTLYAHWSPYKHNLILDANGGIFSSGQTTVSLEKTYGSTITINDAPTRAGYKFLGYAYEQNATTPVLKIGEAYGLDQNGGSKTMYAVWRPLTRNCYAQIKTCSRCSDIYECIIDTRNDSYAKEALTSISLDVDYLTDKMEITINFARKTASPTSFVQKVEYARCRQEDSYLDLAASRWKELAPTTKTSGTGNYYNNVKISIDNKDYDEDEDVIVLRITDTKGNVYYYDSYARCFLNE